ncbi:MAG: isoaspartyl peptidase/L-asparaginase [Candidatus Obscuribacterales bacterium]|jgi:beta-aspartyl-peptidase (threonine type)|nr:isoaspartyl peptidase/L-asparaginase [Candidatus Obscuribacterales bacterium]
MSLRSIALYVVTLAIGSTFLIGGITLPAKAADKAVLVIHGGAGVEAGLTDLEQENYKKGLKEALEAGFAAWKRGDEAVDVVKAAVCKLEDNPLFNAGRGAVFSHEGKNELDAAIMDGRDRKAGAVAGVTTVKNPILAAIAVMQKSPHVMLVGNGADTFAKEQGLEIVDQKYFFTQKRWDDLQKKLDDEKKKKSLGPGATEASTASSSGLGVDHKFGTVGAVALDSKNNLAAGTSTGGLTNKRWGRVGDSPVIGAGTYASNDCCAVSCTGEGEWFIRNTVASDLAARVRYKRSSVKTAADAIIHGVLAPDRGEGGLIVIDNKGNFAMDFNSPGMFRGWIGADGVPHAFVY